MSRKWQFGLVAIAFLSIGLMSATLIMPQSLEAAKDPLKAPPAPPPPPRIAYVNIAKVLRQYEKANEDGAKLTRKREQFVVEIKPIQEEIAQIQRNIQTTNDAEEKDALRKRAVELQRKAEDIDQRAKKILTEITDRTIVEVYQNIKTIIEEIAVERGLDVVEMYPDASTPDEDKKPNVAQIKLQTPALTPIFVRKELLITDEVVKRLNQKYPAGQNGPDI
jgi:Skp family chaperone for outer membrane proteins